MKLRYLGMMAGGTVAGLLSGIAWLIPNGLMGGALGLSLTIGLIWLGNQQKQQSGTLSRKQVVWAGLASGMLGGLLMAAITLVCAGKPPLPGGFGPPQLPFWAPLVMGVCYGLVLHLAYASRFGPGGKSWVGPRAILGCFVLKTLATTVYLLMILQEETVSSAFVGSSLLALVGAVPFACLWVWCMSMFDPAW